MGVPQFSKKDFVLNLMEKKNQLEQNINNFGQVLAVVSDYSSLSVCHRLIDVFFFAHSFCRTITLGCESHWSILMVIHAMTSMSIKFGMLDIRLTRCKMI